MIDMQKIIIFLPKILTVTDFLIQKCKKAMEDGTITKKEAEEIIFETSLKILNELGIPINAEIAKNLIKIVIKFQLDITNFFKK